LCVTWGGERKSSRGEITRCGAEGRWWPLATDLFGLKREGPELRERGVDERTIIEKNF